MFDHIIGNEKAKAYLACTARRRMMGNSLLFAGMNGIGKSLFAVAFAKMLLCLDDPEGKNKKKIEAGNHPDIRIYRPEGKIGLHSIASMRQFSEEVYLVPYEAKWKVFILHEADRMLPSSANALLKTFEEPAQNAIIILLSSAASALLPTIVSRCRTIHFHPLEEKEIASFITRRFNKTEEEAGLIAHLSQGSLGHAVRLAEEGDNPSRLLLLEFLSRGKVGSYKKLAEMAAELAERVESAKKQIEEEMRKTLLRGKLEDFSASQKQALEKEVEGAVAMHIRQKGCELFEMILAWYRDLHVLSLKGNPDYLIHRDFIDAGRTMAAQGGLPSIESVQKAIDETRLALERSTSLQICLENLFLKLNL